MASIEILEDDFTEMMKIIVDGETVYEGNFWDLDADQGIKLVAKSLGATYTHGTYEYDGC